MRNNLEGPPGDHNPALLGQHRPASSGVHPAHFDGCQQQRQQQLEPRVTETCAFYSQALPWKAGQPVVHILLAVLTIGMLTGCCVCCLSCAGTLTSTHPGLSLTGDLANACCMARLHGVGRPLWCCGTPMTALCWWLDAAQCVQWHLYTTGCSWAGVLHW